MVVNGALLNLQLSRNFLGDAGTLALMDMLKRNGALRLIDIWHVPLSQVCRPYAIVVRSMLSSLIRVLGIFTRGTCAFRSPLTSSMF